MKRALRRWAGACAALAWLILTPLTAAGQSGPAPLDSWEDVVRQTPYWSSQGVFRNILTIRRWVLFEESFCGEPDRHLLFDRRGRFIAYVDNEDSRPATQRKLNAVRQRLAREGQVQYWVKGENGVPGYPFALACNQPHVNMELALERYRGEVEGGQIWGTWDTLRVGRKNDEVSLGQAFRRVYEQRTAEGRISLPPAILEDLAGQLLIESGGQARAHSAANAKGILQLSTAALNDCQIPRDLRWHRLAQMDCALRLTEQNRRNLLPAFEARFGHLPEPKRGKLLRLLLIQAYHGGVSRVIRLLGDGELGAAARYFAEHQARYSAGDIAFGMLFHNLGRDRIGFSSLYYGADVQLASEALEAMAGQ